MQNRYLMLVGKQSPLPEGYSAVLEEVCGSQLEKTAAFMLRSMFEEAAVGGIELRLLSGYRSPQYQAGLFERSVSERMQGGMSRDEAVADTARSVARPYESEHNTGLAADIVTPQDDDVLESFEQTKQFEWLSENAALYGFILRYPKGKEDITGYIYEPWHYRYVGPYDAQCMCRLGLTLEEYIKHIKCKEK